MKATTKIRQYTISLEVRELGKDERETDCHISYRGFGSSLECADATGELENYDTGRAHAIDAGTLRQIREWAESQGY